ncbi:MAG: hypothetical protein AB7Q29_05700 [Vicinamibacterales bacterium]
MTTVDGPAPLDWGWRVEQIAVPMVLLCRPEMTDVLRDRGLPPNVRVVSSDLPETPSVRDRIAWLIEASRAWYPGASGYYWLDSLFIYRNLSFEFLYSDLLTRAIARFAPHAACFRMPGYDAESFFGGPAATFEALGGVPDDPIQLFERRAGQTPAPVFRSAFDLSESVDLNLPLATVIDAAVLHVVGDSHVLNCLTKNAAIGCRPNVLVRIAEMSAAPVPYVYQFSHHLGSRTMHFAGRPGALPAVARECGVKSGDAVVWVFGEIDVRSHILRQRNERGRALEEVIGTLARDYVNGILDVHAAHERLRSVVFTPIPPLDNPGYSSVDLPVHGTIEERIDATRRLGSALAELCERHGLLFLDVSAHYESPRGDLRWELSDYFCHIASGCQAPAVRALYDLLARDAQVGPDRGVTPMTSA